MCFVKFTAVDEKSRFIYMLTCRCFSNTEIISVLEKNKLNSYRLLSHRTLISVETYLDLVLIMFQNASKCPDPQNAVSQPCHLIGLSMTCKQVMLLTF